MNFPGCFTVAKIDYYVNIDNVIKYLNNDI